MIAKRGVMLLIKRRKRRLDWASVKMNTLIAALIGTLICKDGRDRHSNAGRGAQNRKILQVTSRALSFDEKVRA